MADTPKKKTPDPDRRIMSVNTGPELHSTLQRIADEKGQSLNAFLRVKLQEFADQAVEPSDERKEDQIQTHSRSFGILLAQLKAAQDKAADEGAESEAELLSEVVGNVEKLRDRLEATPSHDDDDDAPVEMKWGPLIGAMVGLLLLVVGAQARAPGGGPQIVR